MKPASPRRVHLCHRAEERDFIEVQLSACALKAPIRKVNEIQGRDAGEPESAGGLIDGLTWGSTYLLTPRLPLAGQQRARLEETKQSLAYSQNEDSSRNKSDAVRDLLPGFYVCVCYSSSPHASGGELIPSLRHRA